MLPIIRVKDNQLWVMDDGDTTKKLVLQLSGLTTATTRTDTIPDLSGRMLVTAGWGTRDSVLTSNGPTSPPTWRAAAGGGGTITNVYDIPVVIKDNQFKLKSAADTTHSYTVSVSLLTGARMATLVNLDGKSAVVAAVYDSLGMTGSDGATKTWIANAPIGFYRVSAAIKFNGGGDPSAYSIEINGSSGINRVFWDIAGDATVGSSNGGVAAESNGSADFGRHEFYWASVADITYSIVQSAGANSTDIHMRLEYLGP
jgi:hypothetical protein